MTYKAKTPPGRAGGARKCSELGAFEQSEHNPTETSLQAMRVTHLARRFALQPAMAAAVAALAFESGEARA